MLAGHAGDGDAALAAWGDHDPRVREAALGALARCGALDGTVLGDALRDPEPLVRRRAAELSAHHLDVGLLGTLDDDDPDVVEVAAWACGEQLEASDDPDLAVIERLAALATDHEAPLVREAAAASLGAIGHPAGLAAILHACSDKPQIRRRAVLALAPFEGAEVDAAIDRALTDRDWQVRQAAEDLRRAHGELET